MADLATLGDYRMRHGEPADAQTTTTRLADATSFVRQTAHLTISKVTDDEATLDGSGGAQLLLPEFPVLAVASVVEDGTLLTADQFQWWDWGLLQRCGQRCWSRKPRSVVVSYDHGWDPTPEWVTALVCAMVQRASLPQYAAGISSETTGTQAVSFMATAGGVSLWLTDGEVGRLRELRGPLVG